MRPRNGKEIAQEYARMKGIPEEHMVHMVHTLYQYTKDLMGTFDHNMIALDGLGTLFFRVWKIEDEVKKCSSMLRKADLPIPALLTIQERRQNLVKMDMIILTEINRRAEEREYLNKLQSVGGHIPTAANYINNICRCTECKAAQNKIMKVYRDKKVTMEKRDKERIKKLKEYEATRETKKGVGE